MATQAVGEDIEALCGKCGQVWHVVMAKVGTRIAKVVCKRCHGQHLYRTETPDGGQEDVPSPDLAGFLDDPGSRPRS